MSALVFQFGRVVRVARQERGLSQETLAELADLNRSYVGEIERGLATPSLITVEKIAAALQLKPSSLIKQCET